MKVLGFLLCLAVAVLPSVMAQEDSSADLAQLPLCALSCMTAAIGNSPCSPTDQTCICNDVSLQAEAEDCVRGSCTMREALYAKNVTLTNCNVPVRDRTGVYNIVSITLGTISGVFVTIRILYKVFGTKMDLGLDDWFIVLTLFTGIPCTAIYTHGLLVNGLGRDVWTVPHDSITAFVLWFYVMEVLYFAEVALLKMSLLFFYMRIFDRTGRLRNIILATVAANALYGVVFVLIAIFQCAPVNFYWNSWDGEHEGKCLNVNAIAWANAVVSIVLDVWMLALPLSQIATLNLHWKKKVGVAIMFSVGTFVTIVSVLRLQSLVAFANSHNPTWDQFDVANWSTIEINVGIICACMPALRLVLVRCFPRILGSSGGPSERAKYYVHNSGTTRSRNAIAVAQAKTGVAVPGGKGIMYSKSYTVDYHDESNLVPLEEVGVSTSKATSSRTTSF